MTSLPFHPARPAAKHPLYQVKVPAHTLHHLEPARPGVRCCSRTVWRGAGRPSRGRRGRLFEHAQRSRPTVTPQDGSSPSRKGDDAAHNESAVGSRREREFRSRKGGGDDSLASALAFRGAQVFRGSQKAKAVAHRWRWRCLPSSLSSGRHLKATPHAAPPVANAPLPSSPPPTHPSRAHQAAASSRLPAHRRIAVLSCVWTSATCQ